MNKNNENLEGILNGRYKKIKIIGKGSQGTVFEVEDTNETRKELQRKAIKKYHPIPVDISDTLKWIEDEIDTLKTLSGKSEYVINYLDSFVTYIEDNEFKIYHVVNNLYEVSFKLNKRHDLF